MRKALSPKTFMNFPQDSSLRSTRIRPSRSNPQLNTWRWPEDDRSRHKRTNSECFSQPPQSCSDDSFSSSKNTDESCFQHNDVRLELEAEEIPVIPQLPTKLHGMRRFVGFRKYNAFLELSSRALQVSANIEFLIDRKQEYAETAFAGVNTAIKDLNIVEFRVLQECDRILLYEQKNFELQFLNRNIEACIQKSIGVVREQLPAFNVAANDNCTELYDILQRPWLDHNYYRFTVATLQDYIRCAQRFSTTTLANWIKYSEAAKLAKTVRGFVVESLDNRPLKKFMEAGVNLEILQSYMFNDLNPAEEMLTKSVKESQAITKALVGLSIDIRATQRLLEAQAQKLAIQKKDFKQKDLYEEERLLFEVIFNGRQYDKEVARKRQKANQLANPPGPSNTLPPISPAERRLAQDASPVWAQSWQDSPTKILKNRRHKGGSPEKESKAY